MLPISSSNVANFQLVLVIETGNIGNIGNISQVLLKNWKEA